MLEDWLDGWITELWVLEEGDAKSDEKVHKIFGVNSKYFYLDSVE